MEKRVPDDPDLFFTEFFPEQYDAYPAFPRGTTPGSATFEVPEVGAWSLHVMDRKLRIERGVSADSVLRLTMSAKDFTNLFVVRARAAMEERGELPNELRHAFLPLFIDDRKKAIAEGTTGSLRLLLKDEGTDYELRITPGRSSAGGSSAGEKASVRLALSDFLGLTSGKKKIPLLLATGKLSVRGDMAHALKLSGLLS